MEPLRDGVRHIVGAGIEAVNVIDMSVAFMVVAAPDGVSTAVNSAGSTDVPCTYGLSAMVVRVSGVVCLTTGR